jgi:hypothetical protein
MKELSLEQKAKRYDEALEKAKDYHEQLLDEDNPEWASEIEKIFPELKESEDEKIRKWLITQLELKSDVNNPHDLELMILKSIAWLEKQSEQKPTNKQFTPEQANVLDKHIDKFLEQNHTDNVKPKFHEGDCLVNIEYGDVVRVLDVLEDNYRLDFGGDTIGTLCTELVDNDYRLWDITKDAKDGDVIYLPNGNNEYYFFIFKGIENAAVKSFAHFYQYNDGTSEAEGTIDNLFSVNDVFQPATKEQCDLFFQKMKEAGYEWNAEKKELKKIIDKKQIKKNLQDNSFRRMFEQKPAWSKEDENRINRLIAYFEDKESFTAEDDIVYANWLKSLKERVQPQPKQEWKQENTDDLTDFENAMMHIGGSFFGENAALDPNDTNTIKEQANFLLELVPKQEWSKEDEDTIKFLISHFCTCHPTKTFQFTINEVITHDELLRKIRYLKHQNKWELSEEDLRIINNIILVLSNQECWDAAYGRKENLYQKEIYWLKSIKDRVQPKQEMHKID